MSPTPGEPAGMTGNKMVRRRNEEAGHQGWKCYWCRVQMTAVPPYHHGLVYPKTMVTLDHLYHRGDPRRASAPKSGEKRYVAACRRCNEERGKVHERTMGSKRHPKAPRALQFGRHPLPLEPAS
jgi:hypothetical protein